MNNAYGKVIMDCEYLDGFPSPTGVNHYEFIRQMKINDEHVYMFPSPTGVNHYEYEKK